IEGPSLRKRIARDAVGLSVATTTTEPVTTDELSLVFPSVVSSWPARVAAITCCHGVTTIARRRLPWGFQVLALVLFRYVRSPSHLPGGFLECERVLVVHRRVRETSLSQMITFRQSGNTSGGRPRTALSGGGDPTERHAPRRQECR